MFKTYKLPNIKIILTGQGRQCVPRDARSNDILKAIVIEHLQVAFKKAVCFQIDASDYDKLKDWVYGNKADFFPNSGERRSDFFRFAKVFDFHKLAR